MCVCLCTKLQVSSTILTRVLDLPPPPQNKPLKPTQIWLKARLCSARNPEKSSPAFTTFWFKFAVTELAPKLFNSLCHCAASIYVHVYIDIDIDIDISLML